MVEAPKEFKNFFKNFNFLKIFTNYNIGNIPFQSKFNLQANDQIICNHLCSQDYIFENYDLFLDKITELKEVIFCSKKISNNDIKKFLKKISFSLINELLSKN